jgi:hypothetical protein
MAFSFQQQVGDPPDFPKVRILHSPHERRVAVGRGDFPVRRATDHGQASGPADSRAVSSRSFAVLLPRTWELGARSQESVYYLLSTVYCLPHTVYRLLPTALRPPAGAGLRV